MRWVAVTPPSHSLSPGSVDAENQRARSSIIRRSDEDGFVFAMCAIFMTVMIAMGGFAVDIGNWYLHSLRMQRAADSAALAGSVFMPSNFSTAKATALTSLTANGAFDQSPVITQSTADPTHLTVQLTADVHNYFIGMLGMDHLTLTRQATAEYRPYIPMGSPSNVVGVEPDPANTWQKPEDVGFQDSYWLNIAGGQTAKQNGDRYSGGECSSSPDNCTTGPTIPNGNTDYQAGGQLFVVHLPSDGVNRTIQLQAYDPEFAYVSDLCDASTITNNQAQLVALNTAYASGNNAYCTGDQLPSTTGLTTPTDTTYELWTPTLSPGGSKKVSKPGCSKITYPGYKGDIYPKVNPAAPTYDPAFTAAFRKWTTLCTLTVDSSMPAGDYLLHVSTPANQLGLNRFGLRVGVISGGHLDTAATDGVSVFSEGRLVIYAHDNTADVQFYLARLQSSAAGHNMLLTFFDIGDAAGGANLTVTPAPDAKQGGVAMTSFSDCKYTPPKSTVYQTTSSNCSINNITSANYNGRIVNVLVSVPSDYRCNDADPNGCWTRLKLHYGAGSVSDTTSWDVALDGAPVHLVASDPG